MVEHSQVAENRWSRLALLSPNMSVLDSGNPVVGNMVEFLQHAHHPYYHQEKSAFEGVLDRDFVCGSSGHQWLLHLFLRFAMSINVIECESFHEFLCRFYNWFTGQSKGSVIKLSDYGVVAPMRTDSGTTVMAPQSVIVATAYTDGELIRWTSTSTWVDGISPAGPVYKIQDIRGRLELEGFIVSEGEWEKKDIERLLVAFGE